METNPHESSGYLPNLPVLMKFCSGRRTRLFSLLVGVLLLSVVVLAPGLSKASQNGDDLWSLRFDNLSVSEALKELTRATGISLYTNRSPQNKRLTKVYENQTIERILRDVFRGENYTLVWNYGEQGLESIGITFFKNDGRSRESSGGRPSYGSGPTFQRNLDYKMPQAVTPNRQKKSIGRRPQAKKRTPKR
jgi:hypothetical protein